MSTRIYIKNSKLVNFDSILENASIFIEDGLIKYVGSGDDYQVPDDTRVIDAEGKFVLPGGVDPHTHFELELDNTVTIDDFYFGTRAAVAGGTTTIIDFIVPKKGRSLLEAYNSWQTRANAKAVCDYAFHCAITWWSQEVSQEMEILCREKGVNSFKMYMAYKDVLMLNDAELYETFDRCREIGALAQVHAENGDIIAKNQERLLRSGITGPEGHALSRPEEVEAEAVNRACMIANQAKCPLYVVHVMSSEAADEIARARKSYGADLIFGETLASGLGKDGLHCEGKSFYHQAAFVMSPPLRKNTETKELLMRALASDDLQTTGSDNCTFNRKQKELGMDDFSKIPNGINGVEDRMSVVWEKGVHTGIIDPKRFVAITSTNAAKIFNIFPRKGIIAVGSDADLVIWNGNATRVISAETHHHLVDFNIFEGMECHGVPEIVIANGKVLYENGELKVKPGIGRYVRCEGFNEMLYKKEK